MDLDPLGTFSAALALASGGFVFDLLPRKKPTRAKQLLVGGVFDDVFVVAALVSIL